MELVKKEKRLEIEVNRRKTEVRRVKMEGDREKEREVIVTTDIGAIRNRHRKHWIRLQSTGRALRN